MKIQVTIPESAKTGRQARTLEIEINEIYDGGPTIIMRSLTGEEVDKLNLSVWYDHVDPIEELLNHECESCDRSHCDDGNCRDEVNVERVNNKIEELKHVFHQLENLLD